MWARIVGFVLRWVPHFEAPAVSGPKCAPRNTLWRLRRFKVWHPDSSFEQRQSTRVVAFVLIAAALALAGCGAAREPMRFADENHVRPALQTEAAFDGAVALAAERHYDRAADQFAPLVGAYEAAGLRDRAAESLFWLAYCHEKLGLVTRAQAEYRRVVDTYPNAAAARQASDRASRMVLPKVP
jgi:hypothetical protein